MSGEAERSGLGWCRALMADKVYYYPNHRLMAARMSKSEINAKTPKTSLVHLLSAAQSRRASSAGLAAVEIGASGMVGGVQAMNGVDGTAAAAAAAAAAVESRGYVDVEQLVMRGSEAC